MSKGLARFLQHDKSQQIIKRAYLRVKVRKLMDEGVKAFKDILDILK